MRIEANRGASLGPSVNPGAFAAFKRQVVVGATLALQLKTTSTRGDRTEVPHVIINRRDKRASIAPEV